MTAPELSLVTVTWNCAADLRRLLESLERHLARPYEVVVVDNASADDVAAVAASDPAVRLVQMDRNAGFGAANNVGVREARAPVVVMLNPDTYAIDGSLSELADAALASPALLGPRVLNPDLTVQPSASPRPGGWEMALLALVPGRVLPSRLRRRCEPWAATASARAGWLAGACVAAQRQLLLDLGPFDPSIHLYSEDLDLGIRASGLGVESYIVPEVARLVHIGDVSSRQAFPDAGRRLAAENRLAVITRRAGRRRAVLDLALQAAAHLNRLLLKTVCRRPARWELEALGHLMSLMWRDA